MRKMESYAKRQVSSNIPHSKNRKETATSGEPREIRIPDIPDMQESSGYSGDSIGLNVNMIYRTIDNYGSEVRCKFPLVILVVSF